MALILIRWLALILMARRQSLFPLFIKGPEDKITTKSVPLTDQFFSMMYKVNIEKRTVKHFCFCHSLNTFWLHIKLRQNAFRTQTPPLQLSFSHNNNNNTNNNGSLRLFFSRKILVTSICFKFHFWSSIKLFREPWYITDLFFMFEFDIGRALSNKCKNI